MFNIIIITIFICCPSIFNDMDTESCSLMRNTVLCIYSLWVCTAPVWPAGLTTPAGLTPETKPGACAHLFPVGHVCPLHSLEEMADMDELFGSDGDSDNDQRGTRCFKGWF